jgi:hypothetical protein
MKSLTNPSPRTARIMVALIVAFVIFVGIPALRWVDASDRADASAVQAAYNDAAKYDGSTFIAVRQRGNEIAVTAKDPQGYALTDRFMLGEAYRLMANNPSVTRMEGKFSLRKPGPYTLANSPGPFSVSSDPPHANYPGAWLTIASN